jgi:hypothetical protein
MKSKDTTASDSQTTNITGFGIPLNQDEEDNHYDPTNPPGVEPEIPKKAKIKGEATYARKTMVDRFTGNFSIAFALWTTVVTFFGAVIYFAVFVTTLFFNVTGYIAEGEKKLDSLKETDQLILQNVESTNKRFDQLIDFIKLSKK